MSKSVAKPITSAKEAASDYITKGWQVVPLAPKSKAPPDEGWIRLVFKADDFGPSDNIGIRSVGGTTDIDCDCREVVAVAPAFLPPTGCVYGRPSKPMAHWLYKSVFEKTIAFKDLVIRDKNTLIEIRVNHQSMAPPSIHPDDGEVLAWQGSGIPGDPLEVDADLLKRAVRLTATCAMVCRYYNPPGQRHEWGLALAGFLHMLGLTEEESKRVMEQAGRYVRDPEVKDRLQCVRSTYARSEQEEMQSTKALREAIGENGTLFIKSLNKIWGAGASAFVLDKKDNIIANHQDNVTRALEKLEVALTYDLFSGRALVKYKNYHGFLDDNIRNRLWLDIDREFHFRPTAEFFDIMLKDVANRNSFHPVRDYLRALTWDQIPRLDSWLILYGGAADTPYTRAVGTLVLIAGVRRVMTPGIKFDELLVLESEQGRLKSSALRALCPHDTWFSDDLPLNVEAKQVIERTQGKWIIEASELTGLGKKEGDHLKSFLSRQTDGPVRMAYDRLPKEQPRQFIIVGTTNSHQYLHDATGNRRFWPVRVQAFDVHQLLKDRDQLWAEAAHREAAGESIRLKPEIYGLAAIQQERRRTGHPWEQTLEDEFSPEQAWRLTPEDIWSVLHISIDKRTQAHNMLVGEIMQKLHFRSMTVRDKESKKNVKGWGREILQGTPKLDLSEKERE